jgi:uncharacterized protein with PIN domain
MAMKAETSRAYDINTLQLNDQHYFPRCQQCNGVLSVPEWSEQVGGRCVRHLWSCEFCGYQFESWVYAKR